MKRQIGTCGDTAWLRASHLEKVYKMGHLSQAALKDISLSVDRGEFIAVMGASGSGKTTLLNLITAIDRPSTGEVWVGGEPLHKMDEDTATEWRGRQVGIVFQFFQLVPTLTVLENVILPMDFADVVPRGSWRSRAMGLLEEVGMAGYAEKRPVYLSGGEQQRVAIARALANNPALVVADEPTGNLDTTKAEEVFGMLRALARQGKAVIMVTHNEEFASRVDRTVRLRDGQLWQPGVTAHA